MVAIPMHARLLEGLRQAGHAVAGARGTGPGDVRLDFAPGATPAQVAAALAAAAGFDWSPAAHDAWLAARWRGRAKGHYDEGDPVPRLLRAVALVAADEINLLRQWLTGFKGAVAAATSLADLKARVALLPDLPDRTPAQARAAVRNRIDAD